MEGKKVHAGDIVVTDFDMYQHYSIVSDRIDRDGNYMLISATKRTGTVQEEPWLTVTEGRKTYITQLPSTMSVGELLEKARSQIGYWQYAIPTNNCEHFVKWASGVEITSKQVKMGLAGAALGAAAVKALSNEPKWFKFLGIAFAAGALAVYAAKAEQD